MEVSFIAGPIATDSQTVEPWLTTSCRCADAAPVATTLTVSAGTSAIRCAREEDERAGPKKKRGEGGEWAKEKGSPMLNMTQPVTQYSMTQPVTQYSMTQPVTQYSMTQPVTTVEMIREKRLACVDAEATLLRDAR